MTPDQIEANAVMGALYEPEDGDVLRRIVDGREHYIVQCIFRKKSKSGRTWRVHGGAPNGRRVCFDWVYPHLWEPTGERLTADKLTQMARSSTRS